MNTLPQSLSLDSSGSLDRAVTELHEQYVASINQAVGADDLVLADELARAYDDDVRELTAQRAVLAA